MVPDASFRLSSDILCHRISILYPLTWAQDAPPLNKIVWCKSSFQDQSWYYLFTIAQLHKQVSNTAPFLLTNTPFKLFCSSLWITSSYLTFIRVSQLWLWGTDMVGHVCSWPPFVEPKNWRHCLKLHTANRQLYEVCRADSIWAS